MTKHYHTLYHRKPLRVGKVDGLTLAWIDSEESASGFYDEIQSVNNDTWWYRYDGQMCFEEDLTKITGAPGNAVATITGTSYALGARGIDMLRPFEVENTSGYPRTYGAAEFPLYDGHGNMMATLSRSSSSPYYAVGSERTYDVWGGVRSGASSGDPNTRYCANLGHKQDDESGLIYMRARYYEPGTGRFISEDPARDGWNWYVYCGNEPIGNVDADGRRAIPPIFQVLAYGMLIGFFGSLGFHFAQSGSLFALPQSLLSGVVGTAITFFVAFMMKITFGADGLAVRIPVRVGHLRGVFAVSSFAWIGGYLTGMDLLLGLRAGQVLFELFYIENWEIL